jgi:cell division protein FtsI (penicillin-binding protein 3)
MGIAIVCGGILWKAFYIQQIEGQNWKNLSDSLHQKMENIEASRGTIYSANGQMLSTSIPQFDVFIDFGADGLREKRGKRFRENIDSLSDGLAKLFKDKNATEYKSILTNAFNDTLRYFSLKKNIGFREYQQLRALPLVKLGRNKSGFIFETKSIRLNPYQLLAYRTIGLNRENSQKVGLEATYDTVLKGIPGRRMVRYIAGGVSVPVENGDEIDPQNGKDIYTTIDTYMQEIVENALMKVITKNNDIHGCAIVMETNTGQIKAIANLGQRPDGSYFEDYNYAMSATEPGSTIKLATLLSVLSEGVPLNETVEVGTSGSAFVGVRNVNDAEPSPKAVLTLKESFEHSSNVGMSKIAYKTFASHPQKFLQYLHRFHLDSASGIDLAGEDKPKLPRMNRTGEGLSDMITMSFGYAIQVTPLQTLMLYNAIANNGTMVKPYLVSSIKSEGNVIKQFEPTVLRQNFVSPQVIKAAKECMYGVTTEGTAKSIFKDCPFPVGGKTGTAHVADGKLGYSDNVFQATFVGFFPFDKPQYTCIVVIKTKPYAAVHWGAPLAGPVFKEIADRLYTLYIKQDDKNKLNTKEDSAVMSVDSAHYNYIATAKEVQRILGSLDINIGTDNATLSKWVKLYGKQDAAKVEAFTYNNKEMPALSGMGLKDALYLCENMGLKVRVSGKGKVVSQSLQAGTSVNKGEQVQIVLN